MGKLSVQLGSVNSGKRTSFSVYYYPLYSYRPFSRKGLIKGRPTYGKRKRRPAYFGLVFGVEDKNLGFQFGLSSREWRNFIHFLKWSKRNTEKHHAIGGFDFYEKPGRIKTDPHEGVGTMGYRTKSEAVKMYKWVNAAMKRQGKEQIRFSRFLNEVNWTEIERTGLDDSICLTQSNNAKGLLVSLPREQFIRIRTCCLKADRKLSFIKRRF